MVRMLSDIQGAAEVALPNGLLAEMGVTRETKRRALEALEGVGLVRVNRCPGRLPRVALARLSRAPEG
jgi:DNA-binding transcriptional ArsR family regulator